MIKTLGDDHFLAWTGIMTIAMQLLFFFVAYYFQFDKVTDLAGSMNFILIDLFTFFASGFFFPRQIMVSKQTNKQTNKWILTQYNWINSYNSHGRPFIHKFIIYNCLHIRVHKQQSINQSINQYMIWYLYNRWLCSLGWVNYTWAATCSPELWNAVTTPDLTRQGTTSSSS